MTKGLAAPDVEHAYLQAHTLCQQMGETPALVPLLYGLWRFYSARAQWRTAHELGDALLRLTQQAPDPALVVIGHYALGFTCLSLGEFLVAQRHLEDGIARYTPDQRQAWVFRMGTDLGIGCRCYAATTRWVLGYPAQALAHIREALAQAQALAHPFSLVSAWMHVAVIAQFRRDVPGAHAHAAAAVALATEQVFPLHAAVGMIVQGWARVMQGQGEAGVAQVRQGIAAYRATGAVVTLPVFYTMLADAAAHVGHIDEGHQALTEAHRLAEQQEERGWEAEIYRLRGVLLWRQTDIPQAEVETWLQRALDVARRQEAKTLELRAAMSLSRLWQQQGKRTAAHDLLAPVYHWFTEGFDTADLQEARTLLEALS
jgi:predicted ATPase